MREINFEWDNQKEAVNLQKHGIAFEEAESVFYDDGLRIISDPDHSGDEERFIALGFSELANLLVVYHCYRKSDTVIRIFSARKATKTEAKTYKTFR